jgi:hypothetical protein
MSKFIAMMLTLCFILVGCLDNHKSVDLSNNSAVSQATESTEPDIDTDYKLIVNGKDITEGNYVHVYNRNKRAAIPISAVLREVGVSVNWANDTIVTFEYGVYRDIMDTSLPCLGFKRPPGGYSGFTVDVINGEIIMDVVTGKYLLLQMGLQCYVDADKRIVEIVRETEPSIEYHTMEEFESYAIGDRLPYDLSPSHIVDGVCYYLMENGNYICVTVSPVREIEQEIQMISWAEHPYAQYFTDSPEESATITPEVEE